MRRLGARTLLLAIALPLFLAVASPGQAQQASQTDDPYLWLEEVEGQRALEWVAQHNQRTLAELGQYSVYDSIFGESLAILNSEHRIPYPSIMGEHIYNLWQDEVHERGIWRRTSWESYLTGDPGWEILLDIDQLAANESEPWVFWGARCLGPAYERCMIRLSRGGAVAREIREFDLTSAQFVDDGFFVPEAKTMLAWRSRDELLISTDYGEGSLTTAGNPRTVRLWRRGEPLAAAETLLEGDQDDVAVIVASIEVAGGGYHLVMHRKSFYQGAFYVVTDTSLVELLVPPDAVPTFLGDQLVLQLRSDWDVAGITYRQGAVVAIPYAAFLQGERTFSEVVVPSDRQAVVGRAMATKDCLVVNLLVDARSELWRYREDGGEWIGDQLETPGLGTPLVRAASPHTNRFFFSYSSDIQPTTLYMAEEDGSIREVYRLPELFNAEDLVVEQHEATSSDGTRVPYFMVHKRGMALDGTNPTVLYGYGGFQTSLMSDYNPILGKAWLERGGVWATANIRGGGEFGPSWHQAAVRENRQRSFDDFLAVARDLIATGVTSPDHLGIDGASNGGLLVGVAMTQAPELFSAVAIEVPLLDMRRFNKLGAGAGWLAEYGNPDITEEWAYLRQYSPYHNIQQDADYSVPLFYTTTRDDMVHAAHARKMAAKMEAMGHRVLYYESSEGGHGSGITAEQKSIWHAILFTYLSTQLKN